MQVSGNLLIINALQVFAVRTFKGRAYPAGIPVALCFQKT